MIDSLGASGAEHSTAQLLPKLREAGHEVAVATLYDAGYGDEERIRADGFVVGPLGSTHYVGRVRELRSRVREWHPDVVHTALFSSDLVGRIAAWRTGPVVVSSLVNTPYDEARLSDPAVKRWKVRILQMLDAASARLTVDRFHAVSRGAAEANARALRLDLSRISVVERGRSRETLGFASPERRERVRNSLHLSSDAKVVLAVGRQEHQKRHVDLIAAADDLVEAVPSLRLLIAGREGNASKDVRDALAAHPRAAMVTTLLGHRHDVPDLLCAADVLAIPSAFEGTAGAALEAMALDCPVVCTAVEGVRGILEDRRNALLVPPASPRDFSSALGRVLSDSDLCSTLRRDGRIDFEERFTIEASATRMIGFYEALLAEGSQGLRRRRRSRIVD